MGWGLGVGTNLAHHLKSLGGGRNPSSLVRAVAGALPALRAAGAVAALRAAGRASRAIYSKNFLQDKGSISDKESISDKGSISDKESISYIISPKNRACA